ncbi:MAG: DUF1304 domain-containing protein [Chloroflexota bacterium]
MKIVANILVAIVAIEHIYILILEMFLWTTPRSLAAFGMTLEQAEMSKTLAANQGLYNGFLAAGLVAGLLAPNAKTGYAFKLFFLICVTIAGIYGGMTASPRIVLIQAVPAIVALIFVWLSRNSA